MRAIYRMVPFSVTLSDLEGHFSAVVTLCAQLTCDVSDSCVSGVGLHKFYIKLSLCGPSCGGGAAIRITHACLSASLSVLCLP